MGQEVPARTGLGSTTVLAVVTIGFGFVGTTKGGGQELKGNNFRGANAYGTLQNGTLHNGAFHNGTLQNGKALQNGTVTKRYVTKRYTYFVVCCITVHYCTEQYVTLLSRTI
jgi:hypothetical protein